jgi:hypothetical protein
VRTRTKEGVAVVAVLALGLASQVFSNGRTTDPIGVAVSPQTLILSLDQGGAVTVHTAVPFSTVDRGSLTLNGVPADATWADNRGNVVARFSETAIEALVAPPSATLTLCGSLTSGDTFSGSDTVRVIE